jgi:predicted RNA-binding protein Jag
MAEQHRLQSRSTGLEPNRRVRIFREADMTYSGASA